MSGASALGRALTKRQKRPEVSAPLPYREDANYEDYSSSHRHSRSNSHQFKFATGTIKRSKISGPVDLVSSTNHLAYTAPDIQHSHSKSASKSPPKSTPSTSSSSSSLRSGGSDTDLGNHHSSTSTPATSPEGPSLETAHPLGATTDDPSYKTASFGSTHRRSNTDNSSTRSRISSSTTSSNRKTPLSPPSLPHRSLSHSKKSHQDLTRQPSRSKMNAPPPTSISSTHASRVTQQNHSHSRSNPSDGVESHPFGKELEQVNEVAEEFGGYGAEESDEEERELLAKGYCKFSVEDYLLEVHELYRTIFDVGVSPPGEGWI